MTDEQLIPTTSDEFGSVAAGPKGPPPPSQSMMEDSNANLHLPDLNVLGNASMLKHQEEQEELKE